MQGRTILLLSCLAIGLGALVLVQEEEARGDPDGLLDFPVFDVAPDLVRAMSIDHAEGRWQVRVERDARDVWMMTDPIAYPANDGPVRQLLEQVRGLRGTPIDDLDDPSKVGLDPPRAVVVATTRDEAGTEKQARVEVGSVDGDTQFVRSGARILRVRRTLENALVGNVEEFRSRRMFDISLLERPIELVRRGSIDGRDVALEAVAEGSNWMLVRPARGRLDPLTAHLFLQQLLNVRIERFHSDDPGPLERYGLAEPELRIAVTTASGNTSALRFGRVSDTEPWFATREGYPFVWQASARDVAYFASTFEELLDYKIVRAKRESIIGVRLEGGGEAKRLYRVGEQWRLTDDMGPGEPESHLVADEEVVGDLLAKLERAELAAYLPLGTPFVPSDPPVRLLVETQEGELFGGVFGAPHAVPGAESGRTFRRDGDELVAIVSDDVAEPCSIPLEELRTRLLHRLVEREQFSVHVQRGSDVAGFVLDRKANVWRAEGMTLEARGFASLLDRVLSIRARRWLAPEEAPDEADAIDVSVKPVAGQPIAFRLVRGSDGADLCFEDGRWAEIRPGLYEGLAALLAR